MGRRRGMGIERKGRRGIGRKRGYGEWEEGRKKRSGRKGRYEE